jgi:hypothetical protein
LNLCFFYIIRSCRRCLKKYVECLKIR